MHGDDLIIWKTQTVKSPFWVIRYVDPATGKRKQLSTKTANPKEAERILGELRADLLKGRHQTSSGISWEAFRLRYENEYLSGLAKKTELKVCTIFDVLERELGPIRLRDLTTEKLSYFQARLRGTGRAETTIAGYLAHLRAALRWAVDIGLIAVAPKIQRPKRAKSSKVMKGRPITEQEFQLMLEKTVTVVGPEAAASWRHYLRGLWWSGLRLAESMDLYWDDDTKLCVHFADGEVFIRVPAALEKGNKDRLLPVAPEFADFLSQTPRVERVGPVFNPKARRVCGPRLNIFRVSETVRDIGRAAGILVNRGGTKYASAHDLRRSFGERWSALIMPQVLMELMRHESIDTTLKYYVGQNAARTTKLLRAAFDKARSSGETPSEPSYGDTYGDTKGNSAACKQEPNPEKPSG